MGATRTPGEPAGTREELDARMHAEGLDPRWWSNGAGDTYDWHEHDYRKVLHCFRGGIVFHTEDGDVALRAGDRLDLEPGTRHAATVGPDGVTCAESPA